jgi:hypothetical protein
VIRLRQALVKEEKPVHRISFALAVVCLTFLAAAAQTQQTGPVATSVPAASYSQADCSGFIAESALPRDLVVTGGEDNTFHSPVRQFVVGDTIFISHHNDTDVAAAGDYSVVRPANELFLTTHYAGERSGIRKSGKPYENVGRVKVIPLNPGAVVGEVDSSSGDVSLRHAKAAGLIAKITFSCGAIVPGDILVPFQPAPIPEYTVSKPLDPFEPLSRTKLHGRITASRNNAGFLGAEKIIYLNLGEKAGVKPGQRFRIYKTLPPHSTGLLTEEPVPPETVGEAVVLSVRSKSSTAMVTSSYREISAGDYVEAE